MQSPHVLSEFQFKLQLKLSGSNQPKNYKFSKESHYTTNFNESKSKSQNQNIDRKATSIQLKKKRIKNSPPSHFFSNNPQKEKSSTNMNRT